MAISKGALCAAVAVAFAFSLAGATSAFADDYRHVAEAQTVAESRLDEAQDMSEQAKSTLASASLDESGDSENDDDYGSQGLTDAQIPNSFRDYVFQYNEFLATSGSTSGGLWYGNRLSLSGSMIGDNAGGGMFMTGILIGILIGAGGMLFAVRSFGKKKDRLSSDSAGAKR